MSLRKIVSGSIATACLSVAGLGAPAAADSFSVGPGDSIQAAIDRAQPGDVIVVAPGVYAEALRITTDGLTLFGSPGTVLQPPASPPAACDPELPDTDGNGICVLGTVDRTGEEPTVVDYADGVSIQGFRIEGFDRSGIFGLATKDLRLTDNVTVDHGAHGLSVVLSTGSRFISNVASQSEEAGIAIIDSPDASAWVVSNEVSGNAMGVLVRNARRVAIAANDAHDNCAGIVVLGDAPGPAGLGAVVANHVHDNHRFCRASTDDPEAFPAFAGDGIDLLGVSDMYVLGNLVVDNVPTGEPSSPTARFGGGVNVVAGPAGTPSTNNFILGNVVERNAPLDLLVAGDGDNVVSGNTCDAGEPVELCAS